MRCAVALGQAASRLRNNNDGGYGSRRKAGTTAVVKPNALSRMDD